MKKKWKWALIGIIVAVILIALDQGSKYLASVYLAGNHSIALWPGVFELVYLENRGAAFGILQNQRTLFLILTFAFLSVLAVLCWRMPDKKRFLPMRITEILLISGAVGNLIDRIRLEYVVDFFYFKLIDFPVFNVADCYVTVSAFLLFFLILFYYKEEELLQCIGRKGTNP